LLVSGSLRAASSNRAVLETAAYVAPDGISTTLYQGLATLPAFNPDDDVAERLPATVTELRDAIHAAGGLFFSTPEYAGALPGAFKNLLDWTIGDDQPGSIYEKPVGWANASPRGAHLAHESLRAVLGYAHATIVEDACVHVPVTPADIGADGLLVPAGHRATLAAALHALAANVAS
jgi:NAD(P)H-dependent FMN reductase